LLQRLYECRVTRLSIRIVCGGAYERSNAPHVFALLRLRGERPRDRRAAERGDELPSADADSHLSRPKRIMTAAMAKNITPQSASL
jgi:hypothetical protein